LGSVFAVEVGVLCGCDHMALFSSKGGAETDAAARANARSHDIAKLSAVFLMSWVLLWVLAVSRFETHRIQPLRNVGDSIRSESVAQKYHFESDSKETLGSDARSSSPQGAAARHAEALLLGAKHEELKKTNKEEGLVSKNERRNESDAVNGEVQAMKAIAREPLHDTGTEKNTFSDAKPAQNTTRNDQPRVNTNTNNSASVLASATGAANVSDPFRHSAAMRAAAAQLAQATASSPQEILEDVSWLHVTAPEYRPRVPIEPAAVGNAEILGDAAFRARIKTKPPKKPHKFAYVFAVAGNEHALKASVGLCGLRRLGNKHKVYMLASGVDDATQRIVSAFGARVINIEWEPPVPWIPRRLSMSRHTLFKRVFKLNLMALGEFYETGFFMDSDVFLWKSVQDEVDAMIANGVEFAAMKHKIPFCVTSNMVFHRPSLRRMRRLAMRVMVDNFSWNCSRADQSVLSAEFRPWQTHPAPAKSLTAGPRVQPLDFTNRTLQINHRKELHWQWERDGLLRMYDQKFSKHLTGWTPECKRFFEHTLRSEALRSDEFACENATTSCGERLAAVQGV